MKQQTQLCPLEPAEIDQVTGGSGYLMPAGFWEWVPGFIPPWWDPNENPIPSAVPQP